MSLPDNWLEACKKSENRMKDETPIDNIRAAYCINNQCPAAKVMVMEMPFGEMINISCVFSKCVHRYPSKKELKLFK